MINKDTINIVEFFNPIWDEIVNEFKQCDIYWRREYVDAFRVNGDGEPILVYYYSDNFKAIKVVMKRDIQNIKIFKKVIPKHKFYDLSTPYGYGGWIIEGEGDYNILYKKYSEWCVDNNIVSEFVRYHPLNKNYVFADDSTDVIFLGNTISINLESKEEIWGNIISKNRNMIRKAQKNNVIIENGFSWELLKKFIKIYNSTMKKNQASKYYFFNRKFYRSIYKKMSNYSRIFYATLNGKIISMAIILFCGDKVTYHLSGSLKKYQYYAATNLLLYEVSIYYSKLQYKTFHLGGGVGAKEDSLFNFKKSFNKNGKKDYYIGKKIYSYEKYDYLCRLANADAKSNFFPKYRG